MWYLPCHHHVIAQTKVYTYCKLYAKEWVKVNLNVYVPLSIIQIVKMLLQSKGMRIEQML